MASFEREPVIAAARAILDLGGWCLLEACVDIPSQRWQARLLIFDLDADAVADAVAGDIDCEPEYDVRLSGCDRRTLLPEPADGRSPVLPGRPACERCRLAAGAAPRS